jgi:hypothetical protein
VAGRTSVTFEVRDTGIEIPEHARAHVFDPGAQPGEVRRATEGTGLSLAIAKKLVEMMGGKIEVTSPAGRGCSFWFTVVFESVERISERRGRPGRRCRNLGHQRSQFKRRAWRRSVLRQRLPRNGGTNVETNLAME